MFENASAIKAVVHWSQPGRKRVLLQHRVLGQSAHAPLGAQ